MFDFLKPKADPLFTMRVELDPYTPAVLDQGVQVFKVSSNGTALSAGKVAGRISAPVWKYISYFGKVKQMRRIGYNEFEADVLGTADRSLVYEDPGDSPYVYRCGTTKDYPPMLPGTEYHCSLVPNGTDLDIVFAGKPIGKLTDKREGQVDRVKKMLDKGYQPTAQIMPDKSKCSIFVIIRKV